MRAMGQGNLLLRRTPLRFLGGLQPRLRALPLPSAIRRLLPLGPQVQSGQRLLSGADGEGDAGGAAAEGPDVAEEIHGK